MTYETFQATLLAELKGHFPPDTTITVHRILRNNQVAVEGLTILESGFNISPTIYLKEYYEDLQRGMSFPSVFQEILDTYYHYRPTEPIDLSFFKKFQNVSSRIAYKLIHYERNRELLLGIPHIPFLDLAIVFYCLVTSGGPTNATILLTNDHLRFWNTDRDAIYRLALENTPLLLGSRFEQTSFSVSSPIPMYMLTNESGYLGASCLLYNHLLKQLSDRLDADLYIIPSSVHEVLLVPATVHMKPADFNRMIVEVNSSQLSSEEILSDHVYYYSRSSDRITM